jgi:amino acid adenylation domain-containing protein/thioester reductase-like protein
MIAAFETLNRLGRNLPVRAILCDSAATAEIAADSYPEVIRNRPVTEVINSISSLEKGIETFGGEHLLVEVSTGDTGLAAEGGGTGENAGRNDSLRLICRVSAGPPPAVSAALRCSGDDAWRRMAPAVSEIFAELLRELLADPGISAAAAAGIGAGSRRTVLGPLAGRSVDIGPFRSIPAMIEAQVDLRPDRPAISYHGRTLTYRQFDGAANALAAALASRGVGKWDVVPVAMVNGLEMPLAYYALMKIGAAFVPFDPGWPAQRIEAALGVLSPKLVLCAAASSDAPPLLPEAIRKTAAVRVDVDALAAAPAVGRPGVEIGPDDVIYGIFTSGTTGTPKCAMNLHAGLTNRFLFMTRYFGADETAVVLQNSKHTFDSSVWQMFWPLTLGGHAVIPAQGEFLNLEGTIDTIAAYGVTMTDFVPTIFNMMVALAERNEAARRKLSSLRRLIVGGEEITPQTVHKLSSLLPGVRVTNGYGPTEASIGMVFHTVSPEDGDAVPLGRPIDNCYAVILSDDLHLLPPGAQGEIVIGGVCLGSGYFGDPERTAQAFVRNPFPEIPGERLYRTGDLGCFDADGRLWFLGRKDFQVKIGGVRIELGEIESAALDCPHVSQAKVLVAQQQSRKSLAVFAAGDGALVEEELREHMRRVLPRTSLPRHYFVLPEMPLTDHGKVDRRRLQAMLDRKLAEDAARLEYAGTVTVTAGRVLQIFRSVLEKPDLLPSEDFVAVGGDSLQALAVVMELEAAFGVRLGVHDLFENSTAEAMGRLLNRKRRSDDDSEESGDIDGLALMERDSVLPPSVAVAAPSGGVGGDPRTVLLTGATGFVGSRLLHELLARTDLRVVCLCRAADAAAATARTVDALVRLGLWDERFAGRLEVLAGDLGRPALGLSDADWNRLADGCDAILHNGALVNFLFDYRAHRAANVVGTQELLRLAFERRPKSFHHVSTLGVLDGEAALHGDPLPESFDPAVAVRPNSGYSRSKWVAERCIADARAKGAPVTVYRLGEIMPSADNGQPNRQALTHFLLSGFGKLGICPDVPMWSDYTPVDYVAARLVAGLFDRDASGRTLHVFHPERVRFTEILPRVGLPLERVPCAAFLQHLDRAVRETADRELTTLRALLPQHAGQDEAVLRRVFDGLLVDNPRLFRKDECRGLERRWELEDGPLDGAMAAYRSRIGAGAPPAPAAARSAVNF